MDAQTVGSPTCLILTATVQVMADMTFVVRRDTSSRLTDYKNSFTRWMETPGIDAVVLVENSGYDMTEFREIAARYPEKQTEILSFQCPPFDGSLGKGYGEMLCMRYCMEQSELLRKLPRFLKVTGRYYLANAPAIAAYIGAHTDVDIVCNLERNLTWADSRGFGGSVAFLRNYFCPMLGEIDDSKDSTFEHVLARASHQILAERKLWHPLPEYLQIYGVSGSSGELLTPSLLTRLKRQLKHTLYLNLLAR